MVCVQFVGQSHTSDWIVVKDTREDTVAHFSPQGHRFNCNSPYRHWVQAVDRKGGSRGRGKESSYQNQTVRLRTGGATLGPRLTIGIAPPLKLEERPAERAYTVAEVVESVSRGG